MRPIAIRIRRDYWRNNWKDNAIRKPDTVGTLLGLGLKDESLEDSANLPSPDIIATEIVEDLEAALEQFAEIAADLGSKATET